MSKILQNIVIGINDDLSQKLYDYVPDYADYRILKQSVDARRRHEPHFVYTIEVAEKNENLHREEFKFEKINYKGTRPVIIGSGPAGLFAALRLVERGIPCVLFERGSESAERIKGINQYWRYGKLDPRNNVCFGEGGAGLYSDGKLITRIKSDHIPYVMRRLVEFGAPAEIEYLSNPHVGSDRIRRVIPMMREFLKQNGCEIHFNTQVTELIQNNQQITGVRTEHGKEYSTDHVILATGHSADDMIEHLKKSGVHMDGKSFAMGLRIEHPQKLINQIQYRAHAENPKLGSANYKLTWHDSSENVGVYSFCMCPGGYILSSGTEANTLVCNGMSNYKRNSPFANAAIVVSIDHNKHFGEKNVFGGLEFRRQLEESAFQAVQKKGGTKELPAQKLTDFMSGKLSSLGATSSPSGALPIRLDELLPQHMTDKLKEGLEQFNSSMKGYMSPDAQLFGVESRTSCPVRVTRDAETLQSLSHQGLYPTGEGAGYAGGITSAACDGIRVAEAIFAKISSQKAQVSLT